MVFWQGEGGNVIVDCVGGAGGGGVRDVCPGRTEGCAGGEGDGARCAVPEDALGAVMAELEEGLEEG